MSENTEKSAVEKFWELEKATPEQVDKQVDNAMNTLDSSSTVDLTNFWSIKAVVANYELVRKRVIEVSKVLATLSPEYYNGRTITDIEVYENDTVFVTCDDSFGGCTESISFSFPLVWLTLSKEELEAIVREEVERKLAKQKEEIARKLEAAKKAAEERELATYNRLKAKYEGKDHES